MDLTQSANNCWDMFNAVPHDIQTRIITLGLIDIARANFKGKDRKAFYSIIKGNKNKEE